MKSNTKPKKTFLSKFLITVVLIWSLVMVLVVTVYAETIVASFENDTVQIQLDATFTSSKKGTISSAGYDPTTKTFTVVASGYVASGCFDSDAVADIRFTLTNLSKKNVNGQESSRLVTIKYTTTGMTTNVSGAEAELTDNTVVIEGKTNSGSKTKTFTIKLDSVVPESLNVEVTTTFKNSHGGSLTVDGESVSETGTQLTNLDDKKYTLVATPAPGYEFFAWQTLTGPLAIDANINNGVATSEFSPSADTTVWPIFVKAGSAAYYIQEDTYKTYYGFLDEAIEAADNSGTVVVGKSGEIVLSPYKTDPANYNPATLEVTIPSGVNFLIPRDDTDDGCFGILQDIASASSTKSPTPNPKGQLTVPDGMKIVVEGQMNVNATRRTVTTSTFGGPDGQFGLLKLGKDSLLSIESGASLYCYGYIIGEGQVVANSGATIREMMQIADWRGGRRASSWLNISNNNNMAAMLFSQYYVQNIEADLKLMAGCGLYCDVNLEVDDNPQYYTDIPFIDKSGNSGFFKITSGYILREYDYSVDRITYSVRSDDANKANITVNKLELTISGTPIDTSKYVMPINSNMTICITSNAAAEFANDYKLLPEAEIIVEQGGELTCNGDLYIYGVADWTDVYYGPARNTTGIPLKYIASTGMKSVRYNDNRSYAGGDLTDQFRPNMSAKLEINGKMTVSSGGGIYTTNKYPGANTDKVIYGSGEIVNQSTCANTKIYELEGTGSGITLGLRNVDMPVCAAVGRMAGKSTSNADYQQFGTNTEDTPYIGLGEAGNHYWYQLTLNLTGATEKILEGNGTCMNGDRTLGYVVKDGYFRFALPAEYTATENGAAMAAPALNGNTLPIYTSGKITTDKGTTIHIAESTGAKVTVTVVPVVNGTPLTDEKVEVSVPSGTTVSGFYTDAACGTEFNAAVSANTTVYTKAVAKIDWNNGAYTEFYESLDAVAAQFTDANDKATLLTNVDLSAPVSIGSGKVLNLDLNGKNVTYVGSAFEVSGTLNLELKNATISNSASGVTSAIKINPGATAVIDTSGGQIIVDEPELLADTSIGRAISNAGTLTLVGDGFVSSTGIYDSTDKTNDCEDASKYISAVYNSGTIVKIEGVTIEGAHTALSNAGTITKICGNTTIHSFGVLPLILEVNASIDKIEAGEGKVVNIYGGDNATNCTALYLRAGAKINTVGGDSGTVLISGVGYGINMKGASQIGTIGGNGSTVYVTASRGIVQEAESIIGQQVEGQWIGGLSRGLIVNATSSNNEAVTNTGTVVASGGDYFHKSKIFNNADTVVYPQNCYLSSTTRSATLPDGTSLDKCYYVYELTAITVTFKDAAGNDLGTKTVSGIEVGTVPAGYYTDPDCKVPLTAPIAGGEVLYANANVKVVHADNSVDYYADLSSAAANAADDDQVVLLANVSQSGPVVIAADKTVNLDLNGKTVTYTGSAFTVNGKLNLNLNGGTITNVSADGIAAPGVTAAIMINATGTANIDTAANTETGIVSKIIVDDDDAPSGNYNAGAHANVVYNQGVLTLTGDGTGELSTNAYVALTGSTSSFVPAVYNTSSGQIPLIEDVKITARDVCIYSTGTIGAIQGDTVLAAGSEEASTGVAGIYPAGGSITSIGGNTKISAYRTNSSGIYSKGKVQIGDIGFGQGTVTIIARKFGIYLNTGNDVVTNLGVNGAVEVIEINTGDSGNAIQNKGTITNLGSKLVAITQSTKYAAVLNSGTITNVAGGSYYAESGKDYVFSGVTPEAPLELSSLTKEVVVNGVKFNCWYLTDCECVKATKEEIVVEATCAAPGSYDLVAYCSICNVELSRETFEIPALEHTKGDLVVENRVEATEDTPGSYDEVIYCTVCNKELSREPIEIPALGKPVAQIGETTYRTLEAAFEAAVSGDTIILLDNVALDAHITVKNGLDVTLDLSGKTITYSTSAFEVCGTLNLNLNGGIITNGGAATVTSAIHVAKGGTADIDTNDGKIIVDHTTAKVPKYVINAIYNEGTLSLRGDGIISTNASVSGTYGTTNFAPAVYNTGKILVIEDVTIEAREVALYTEGDIVKIQGDASICAGSEENTGIAAIVLATGADIDTIGGSGRITITADRSNASAVYLRTGSHIRTIGGAGKVIIHSEGKYGINIKGSATFDFIGVDGYVEVVAKLEYAISVEGTVEELGAGLVAITDSSYSTVAIGGTVTKVSGGFYHHPTDRNKIFSKAVTFTPGKELSAEAQEFTLADEKTKYLCWNVSDATNPVAEVNGSKYGTIESAIRAASDTDVVKLLVDLEMAAPIAVNKTVKIDLNGHSITSTASSTITVGSAGKLSICGIGTIANTATGEASAIHNSGDISEITGKVTVTSAGMYGIYCNTGATVGTIGGAGGQVEITGAIYGLYLNSGNTVTMIGSPMDSAGKANVTIKGSTNGIYANKSTIHNIGGNGDTITIPAVVNGVSGTTAIVLTNQSTLGQLGGTGCDICINYFTAEFPDLIVDSSDGRGETTNFGGIGLSATNSTIGTIGGSGSYIRIRSSSKAIELNSTNVTNLGVGDDFIHLTQREGYTTHGALHLTGTSTITTVGGENSEIFISGNQRSVTMNNGTEITTLGGAGSQIVINTISGSRGATALLVSKDATIGTIAETGSTVTFNRLKKNGNATLNQSVALQQLSISGTVGTIGNGGTIYFEAATASATITAIEIAANGSVGTIGASGSKIVVTNSNSVGKGITVASGGSITGTIGAEGSHVQIIVAENAIENAGTIGNLGEGLIAATTKESSYPVKNTNTEAGAITISGGYYYHPSMDSGKLFNGTVSYAENKKLAEETTSATLANGSTLEDCYYVTYSLPIYVKRVECYYDSEVLMGLKFVIDDKTLLDNANAKIILTIDGRWEPRTVETPIPEMVKNEDGLYIAYINIPSGEMWRKVTAEVMIDTEVTTAVTKDDTAFPGYTVAQYVETIVKSERASQEQIAAAKSLAVYGHYAKEYFGVADREDAPKLTVLDTDLSKFVSPESTVEVTGAVDGLKVESYEQYLDSILFVRYRFVPEEDAVISNYTVTITASAESDTAPEPYSVTLKEDETDTNGYWYVDTNGIPPALLDEAYTVTVKKGDQSLVINADPMAWISTAAAQGNARADLAKALYLYHKACKDMFILN